MIEFYLSYLILVFGFLAVPFFGVKFSGSDDRYCIGALFGGLFGCIILLACTCAFLALRVWGIS